jgi:2,3-bisphosphoglycerate-dependent phosphoglycerate mutase
MELIIIRHGLPLRIEKTDGSAADPELSPEGIIQAGKMALWLKNEKLDAIYCSPMKRARQTAEPLAEIKQLDTVIEEGIAEIDQHSSAYIPIEEIKAKHPEQWQEIIKKGNDTFFNEIQDLGHFRATVVKSLENIVANNSGKRVAAVCHGGVINIWAAHILEMEKSLFFNPQYTSLNRFMASSSGVHSIVSLNESAHLRDDLVLT